MVSIYRQLEEAILTDRRIMLRMDFDPGWNRLQEENSFEERDPWRFDALLDVDMPRFEFRNTNHLIRLSRNILDIAKDPSVFNRVYIQSVDRVLPFHKFFIGKKSDELSGVFNKFCIHRPQLSEIANPHFVINTMARPEDKVLENDLRALPAGLFIFKPSIETKEGGKERNGLLFSSGIPIALKPDMHGELTYCLALDVQDPKIRRTLRNQPESFVTFTPYIRWQNAQWQKERAVDFNEDHKYIMVQGKIDHPSQVSNFAPRFTLPELSH